MTDFAKRTNQSPTPEEPITPTFQELDQYDTLKKIVAQIESCNYTCIGGTIENNVAFIALRRMAACE